MARRIIVGLLIVIGFIASLFLSAPATVSSAGELAAVYWGGAPVLNQGGLPQCVGYAMETLLQDSPNVYSTGNIPSPYWIYTAAQARDEWRDTVHDGTSDVAAFSYLQQFGYIDSVTYTHDPLAVADYVLHSGPVTMGTEWTLSMNAPDPVTFEITVEGKIVGYHEWVIDGYDPAHEMFDAQNSWGPYYGNFGHFRVSMAAMYALLQNDDAPANRNAALPHKNVTTWLEKQI